METVFAIIAMVFGAVCLYLLSDRTRQLREATMRLESVQINLEGADRQLAELRARGAGDDPAVADRRLKQAQADIERLRAQVVRAEESIAEARAQARMQVDAARAEADRAIADAAAAGLESPLLAERLARLAEAERWIEDLKSSLAEAQAENRALREKLLEHERAVSAETLPQRSIVRSLLAEPTEESLGAGTLVGAKSGFVAARPDPVARDERAANAAVLVIDADSASLARITETLQAGRYTVETAGTAEEGLQRARELRPAVIALDVRLPDRDGWELFAELRRDPATRDIPLVVSSARKEREKAMAAGAAGWLGKPVDASALLSAVKAAVNARRRRERRAAVVARVVTSPGEPAPSEESE